MFGPDGTFRIEDPNWQDDPELSISPETSVLTATGRFDGQPTLDLTNSVTWSSSDCAVAAVDPSGRVTASHFAQPATQP